MNHATGSPFSATVEHLPLGELVQGEIELRSGNEKARNGSRDGSFFFSPSSLSLEFVSRFGIISLASKLVPSPDRRDKLFAKYALRKLRHCIGENEILRDMSDKSAPDSRVQRADGTIDNANTGKIRSY